MVYILLEIIGAHCNMNSMKQILTVTGIGLAIILTAWLLWPTEDTTDEVFLDLPNAPTDQPQLEQSITLTAAEPTLLPTRTGELLEVSNPREFGTALGSNTYELTSEDMPQLDKSYNISYFGNDESFNISLLEEPLGEVRRQAEQELAMRLGVAVEDLCRLKVRVGTALVTNQFVSGRDLGVSVCPGSVQID